MIVDNIDMIGSDNTQRVQVKRNSMLVVMDKCVYFVFQLFSQKKQTLWAEIPIPCSTNTLERISTIAGGRSQKLILLSRGKAMSGAPIRTGAMQLANPAIAGHIYYTGKTVLFSADYTVSGPTNLNYLSRDALQSLNTHIILIN